MCVCVCTCIYIYIYMNFCRFKKLLDDKIRILILGIYIN